MASSSLPIVEIPLIAYVRSVLSAEEFVRLTEELGGDRFHVPVKLRDTHVLIDVIGRDAAERIAKAIAPALLSVPIARYERAAFYVAQGLTDREIRRKLGMCRSGVEKLLNRIALADD